jgi:hypothetical protein
MSENLPEWANGARMAEIWFHLTHTLIPLKKGDNWLFQGNLSKRGLAPRTPCPGPEMWAL